MSIENNIEYPLAYLITFTTYGTWLHGDKRGSVDKKHNQYGSPFAAPASALQRKEQGALKNPAFTLKQSQREIVLQAILKVCRFRRWFAHAAHVRSNHVHIVVSGEERPERMMADFKAYATRCIRTINRDKRLMKKCWTRHGSTKYLWTKESLASAIRYVKNEQGKVMAFGTTDNQSPERQ
jgi:REP element-mobilizing transposase RayT